MNPLKGGWTGEEAQSLFNLHIATGNMLSSLHDTTLDAQLRTPEVLRMYVTGFRALFHAIALLHHTNIEQENSDNYLALEPTARDGWVAYAHQEAMRALAAFGEYQPYLWGSPRTWMDQGLEALSRVDFSLPYATPLPNDAMGIDGQVQIKVTPTVVGPHGDQRVAQWCIHRSAHYFLDALEDAAGVPIGDSEGGRTVFQKGSEALRVLEESMMMLANIVTRPIPQPATMPKDHPEIPLRFLVVERVMDWLQNYLNPFSVPFRYNEVLAFGLSPWIAEENEHAMGRVPLAHAITRVSDAWRQADRGAWSCFFLNFATA